MISDFIKKPTEFISIEESKKYLKETDNDLIAYVSLLSKEKLKGMTLNDALEKQPEVYQFVGSVTKTFLIIWISTKILLKLSLLLIQYPHQ